MTEVAGTTGIAKPRAMEVTGMVTSSRDGGRRRCSTLVRRRSQAPLHPHATEVTGVVEPHATEVTGASMAAPSREGGCERGRALARRRSRACPRATEVASVTAASRDEDHGHGCCLALPIFQRMRREDQQSGRAGARSGRREHKNRETVGRK